jgi:hypothetical protein
MKSPTVAGVIAALVVAAGGWYVISHMRVSVSPPQNATTTTDGQPTAAAIAAAEASLTHPYSSTPMKVLLRVPEDYTIDESYKYQELGPGKDILGTSFTIPASLADGTNLGTDTSISVEQIPKLKECTAAPFLWQKGVYVQTVTENGVTYSVALAPGAAAGTRYEETVYALPGTSPCIAVRYFIHYGAIENYPPGAVHEFDHAALIATFDAIRHSLKVVQ